MKIVISEIPDEGLEVDLAEPMTLEAAELAAPVAGRLSVRKAENEIVVAGELSAALRMECSRCLAKFEVRLDLPVHVVYDPAEDTGKSKHELHGDEMDTSFYRGDELDLGELVQEQVVLSMTMKPLCREDCRGLCPVCGIDLNEGKCSCGSQEVDPRLAVLKKLFDKGKE